MLFKKIIFTFHVLLITSFSIFSQWVQSYIEDDEFSLFPANVNICFSSADSGYIAFNKIFGDGTVYFASGNGGNSWKFIDSTSQFSSQDIVYDCSIGFCYGKIADTSAIEIFSSQLQNRKIYKFPSYREIIQMNIVDSNHAVYLCLNHNSEYAIGILELKENNVNLSGKLLLGTEQVSKIDFFSVSSGWYLQGDKLYLTENLGVSSDLVVEGIYDFDFYSPDTGIYIKSVASDNQTLYKTSDKGKNWQLAGSISAGTQFFGNNYKGALMNSNNSVYILVDWQGNTTSSDIFFYDLINNRHNSVTIYRSDNELCPDWELYFFSSGHGYFLNNYYTLISTVNNGGNTGISFSDAGMGVSVLPNPVSDHLFVDFPDTLLIYKKEIAVYDITGNLIIKKSVQPYSLYSEIDISNFDQGSYIIDIQIENKHYSKKIIKR